MSVEHLFAVAPVKVLDRTIPPEFSRFDVLHLDIARFAPKLQVSRDELGTFANLILHEAYSLGPPADQVPLPTVAKP
ncbi:MAG: hypothetical protein AAGF77_09630 [Bacteroidota bacterium]